jgi:hypothetical protein
MTINMVMKVSFFLLKHILFIFERFGRTKLLEFIQKQRKKNILKMVVQEIFGPAEPWVCLIRYLPLPGCGHFLPIYVFHTPGAFHFVQLFCFLFTRLQHTLVFRDIYPFLCNTFNSREKKV